MTNIPKVARVYVCGVIAVGGCLLATLLPQMRFERPGVFLALLALGAVTARLKLQMPFSAQGATLSVSYGVVFAALLLLGLPEAAFIAIVATCVQTINW